MLINTNSSTSPLDVSHAEVFEEVLEIVSYMTFFAPTISLDMWSLWPLMMEALSEWAIDFFSSELILIFYSQSFFKYYLFYVLSCSSLTGFIDYLPICLVNFMMLYSFLNFCDNYFVFVVFFLGGYKYCLFCSSSYSMLYGTIKCITTDLSFPALIFIACDITYRRDETHDP